MIEMRHYVCDDTTDEALHVALRHLINMRTKLQYRYYTGHYHDSQGMVQDHWAGEWSDWIDVPTVVDGAER